jgi:hypothetical protein
MIQMPTYTGGDFANFGRLMTIYGNQQGQDAENAQHKAAYLDLCKFYPQQYTDAEAVHQPLPALPQMPQMKVYNDDGTVSYSAFPDLTQITVPKPGVASGGIVTTGTLPLEKIDIAIMLLQQILGFVKK